MKVYFDTEFTDLCNQLGPIRLISAGFVAENGSEFYFELTDSYTTEDCSSFVFENVLPHLNHAKYGMTSAQASLNLRTWCEALGERIQLVCDAPAYDFKLIALLLKNYNTTLKNVDSKCLRVDANLLYGKIEQYFEYQPIAIRHHALWDARALAQALKK